MDEDLVARLRARLRDIKVQLITLHALKQEEQGLENLLEHYDRVSRGLAILPNLASNPHAVAEANESFPNMMTNVARMLLLTDVGPTASVSELYSALPEILKRAYRGKDDRSNIETFRSQIVSWRESYNLAYENGKVSLTPETPRSFTTSPMGMAIRTGLYRCMMHPEEVEVLEVGQSVPVCRLSDGRCVWNWESPVPFPNVLEPLPTN